MVVYSRSPFAVIGIRETEIYGQIYGLEMLHTSRPAASWTVLAIKTGW